MLWPVSLERFFYGIDDDADNAPGPIDHVRDWLAQRDWHKSLAEQVTTYYRIAYTGSQAEKLNYVIKRYLALLDEQIKTLSNRAPRSTAVADLLADLCTAYEHIRDSLKGDNCAHATWNEHKRACLATELSNVITLDLHFNILLGQVMPGAQHKAVAAKATNLLAFLKPMLMAARRYSPSHGRINPLSGDKLRIIDPAVLLGLSESVLFLADKQENPDGGILSELGRVAKCYTAELDATLDDMAPKPVYYQAFSGLADMAPGPEHRKPAFGPGQSDDPGAQGLSAETLKAAVRDAKSGIALVRHTI